MIELCFLQSYSTLEEAIIKGLGISKQQIKKYQLKKKVLNSAVKSKRSYQLPIDLINHLKINPQYDGPTIVKLYEDEHVLVLNKPYKIHMHPLTYSECDNVLSFLRSEKILLPELLEVNKNSYDRGLLYRLDYETSGIIYYAKKSSIYNYVRDNFNEVMQQKSYLAIVSGKFEKEGEHRHFLKSSGPKGSRILCLDEAADKAVAVKMSVERLDYNQKMDYSLLRVALDTGHRHQIRAQLAHLSYPILGDKVYGGLSERRLYLHAYQYCFSIDNKNYNIKCLDAKLFDDFFDLNGCA